MCGKIARQFVHDEYAFQSVWVGDSLLGKPRMESIALLAGVAARTKKVRLGPACMASFNLRHPIIFAAQWATLDAVSGGRTILAACLGGPTGPGSTEPSATKRPG